MEYIRKCFDLNLLTFIAYFGCGFGKSTAIKAMAAVARQTGSNKKILHVVPNNTLAREQATGGFGADLLTYRSVAWNDRLSMNDIGEDVNVVTVVQEQLMSY